MIWVWTKNFILLCEMDVLCEGFSSKKKSSQGIFRKKIVSHLHVGVLIWYTDVFSKRRNTKLWDRGVHDFGEMMWDPRCWNQKKKVQCLLVIILILKPWVVETHFVSSNKTHQKLRKHLHLKTALFFFEVVSSQQKRQRSVNRSTWVGQQSQTGRQSDPNFGWNLRFEWWYLGSITNSCKSTKGQVQSLGCWSYDG